MSLKQIITIKVFSWKSIHSPVGSHHSNVNVLWAFGSQPEQQLHHVSVIAPHRPLVPTAVLNRWKEQIHSHSFVYVFNFSEHFILVTHIHLL